MRKEKRITKVHQFGLFRKLTLYVLIAVLGFFVVTANQIFAADFDANDGEYYSDFTSFEETEEHALVVNEKIGEEGFILMKNDGVLPTVDIKNISVFGKNSTNMALGGGGSGQGNTTGAVGIYESLDAAGYNVNPVLKVFYEEDDAPLRAVPSLFGASSTVIGETPIDHYGRQQTDSFALFNDAAVVVITRSGSEGGDLPRFGINDNEDTSLHYLELNDDELAMLALVKQYFENIIVIINNSAPLELGVLEDDPAINAIVWVGHPGTNAIMALGKILNGEVNPSGRTVDIYAEDFTLDPTYQNFGDNAQNSYTVASEDGTDLFISEYIEGGGYNKAIEIFNPTAASIDLSIYSLDIYMNGATTSSGSLDLSGTLASHDVFVIYNTGANAAIIAEGDLANNTIANFNGDDVVTLSKSDVVIDTVGDVGNANNNNFAIDVTLVRRGSITEGNTTFTTSEWMEYAKDTLDHIGSHTYSYQVASSTRVYDSEGVVSNVRALSYEEGIYMGYRYYETRGEVEGGTWYEDNVVYPFGYGLSYTSFSWVVQSESPVSGAVLTSGDSISVTVRVTNTGDVAGKDVVQLYFEAPYISGEIEKSSVVLGGFAKTMLLQPGQHQDVVIELDVQDMASYDYNDANNNGFMGYELDAGNYAINIMRNSHDLVESIPYSIATNIQYPNDKLTGNPVENRFTDDDYFDSLPDDVDGIAMTFMSRADFAGTFPVAPTVGDLTLGATSEVVDNVNHVFVLDDLDDDITAPWYKTIDDMESEDGTVQYTQASEAEVAARVDGKVPTQLMDMLNVPKDDAAWDEFLNQLSFHELNLFVSNGGYRTYSINAVGKVQATDADGPAGFGGGFYWASEVVIASTWNEQIAEQMGQMVGNEALWLGINGWYAPAMNTHRNQFAGRNFEYYSEDGFLAGKMAAAAVRGAQSKGLYTYIKHFALNDQETNRQGIITYVDEQAMREIYLKAFQLPVQEGGSFAVMSSFNRIGEVEASNNYALLVEVLRDEWGFNGHVVTDFFSGGATSSYMNLNGLWAMGNDIPLNGFGSISSGYYATWDETEGAPVYTNLSSEVVPSYSQWWAVRNAAKNILYTSVNSNLMNNFVDLGEIGGALTDGTQAVSYNANIMPEGLSNVKAYLASNSHLPEGLSLSESGMITGTPAVSGSFTFRVNYRADFWADVDTVEYTLELAPAFVVTNLDDLEENLAETDGLVVSNAFEVGVSQLMYLSVSWWGTQIRYATLESITYSVVEGMLPAGLSLDPTGAITGTPTMAGSYDLVIQAHLSARSGQTTQDVLIPATLVVAVGTPLPTFDVTFSPNYPDATSEVVAVVENTPVAEQAAPSRPGAIFLGWFTDMEGTTPVDFTANVSADVTYYANWIDVAQLVEDLSALEGNLDTDVADLADDITAVSAAVTALQTALEADDADLADDIAAVSAAVTALQTALEAADDEITADLADEVSTLNDAIDALNTSIGNEADRIDTIETTLAEQGCGSNITLQSSIVFATILVLTMAVAFVMARSKKQYNK